MVSPGASDRTLEALAEAGVVRVRFNLPSYDPQALNRPDTPPSSIHSGRSAGSRKSNPLRLFAFGR
jgi:hypothetical protein